MWQSRTRSARVWHEARRLLPQLRATRTELRDALSHLGRQGLDSLARDRESVFDLRRACGIHWFDTYYADLSARR